MKILPGCFNIYLEISDNPSALFDISPHVFEVQKKLPM